MNLLRFLVGLAAIALSASIVAAPAEYQASVQQAYGAQKRLQVIALAPFACPRGLECFELEQQILEQLAKRTGSRVTASEAVEDLMRRAGLVDLNALETRLIVAEGLGADAFAFVSITNAEVVVAPASPSKKWAQFGHEVSVKRADLELRVIDRQGVSLAQVSGKAELRDSVRSLVSIISSLFEEMLERAWR